MKYMFKIFMSLLLLISISLTFTSCKFWRYFTIEEIESIDTNGWDNCFGNEAYEFCTVGDFVISAHFNNENDEKTHNLHIGPLSQTKNTGIEIKKVTLYDGDVVCFERDDNFDLEWSEHSESIATVVGYKFRGTFKEPIYIPGESVKMNMKQRYILKVLVEVEGETEPLVKEVTFTFVVRRYDPVWLQ